LLHLTRPSAIRGPVRTRNARLLRRWLDDDVVRTAMGVNTWEGVQYLDAERFRDVLELAARIDAGEGAAPDTAFAARLAAAAEAAGYRVDQLLAALDEPAPARAAPPPRPKRGPRTT
jgi:hypothetical protein